MDNRPDELAAKLRTAIVEGVYPPGSRLVQDHLAEQFGVSRIPMREAMRSLAGEGLIRSLPGRGTFVTELDLDEIDEIYDLRRLIEPSFSTAVIERVSRRDISRFEDMATEMNGVHIIGPAAWSRHNLCFHLDMYRLAQLPLRYDVIAQLLHRLEPYSRYYVHGTGAYERVQEEHHAMVAALVAGDAEELSRQIVLHIDGGQQGLHAAWSRSGHNLHAFWAQPR